MLALKLLLLPLNGRQMRINVGQVRHKRLPGLSLLLLRAVCLAGQPLCILCNQTLLLLHTVNINIHTDEMCCTQTSPKHQKTKDMNRAQHTARALVRSASRSRMCCFSCSSLTATVSLVSLILRLLSLHEVRDVLCAF